MPNNNTIAEARDLNDPELLRQVNLLRKTDNVTNWYYLAREYLFLAVVIGGTIGSCYFLLDRGLSLLWSLPVTLLCIVGVGAGQHRLATLTHEAAHYMLFRNRLLNEMVSEWFCMFPILGTTHSYRVQHLGHHQYPNDPDRDPDWTQMRLSGHRYKFPMTRGRFLWECVFKNLLWPPSLIRYVLVRATFKVEQGDLTPYRMKRRQSLVLSVARVGFTLAVLGVLASCALAGQRLLLAVCPAALLLVALGFLAVAPGDWFEDYAIKSDIPMRWSVCLRVTFNTLVFTGLAWATVLTDMPWWLFYIVLWVLPLGTSFAFFMVMRQIVQHGNADQERFSNTRVFLVSPLLSMAVFPIGNDYHLPHHLFPMVPHYNLRRLHALLMDRAVYQCEAVLVKGYFIPPEKPAHHPTVLDVMTQ
ncbi:MAG TPA: fatty acid desaturase [Gemmataceae bacterium]|nr:fatty acid desaturase [Gemmataceae bacterium]